MKISPSWLREFVDLKVETKKLAEDLTAAGLAVELISGEGDNLVFDMEITANRVDAMNHYGVARECSAIYDLDLEPIEPKLPAAKGKAKFAIELPDPQGCARYTAQIIRGMKIAPSLARIARRLEMVEARPINNGVDASNYTLIEMGHPTHAFDLELQAQGNAGQRVIAIEHHVLGIELGHGVQRVLGRIGVAAGGQGRALDGHAFLQFGRKQTARLQEHQLLVVVAKGLFGLELQGDGGAHAVPLQGILDLLEQVVPADEKLHRLVEHVQFLAQGVGERPGQSDHALLIDVHGAELSQLNRNIEKP